MSGNTTDQASLRASPLPTSDPVESSFFPFTPLCSLGCKPSGANQNNWEGGVASWLPVCDTSASVAAYTRTSVDLDSSTPSDEGGLRSGVVDTYIAGANSINNASGTVAPIYSTSFPNVLLFQPDDMYQAYSDHWHSPADPGFDLPTTSYEATYQIDRIGLEGATFTRAYSASGLCAPSRVALLTGRYASRGEHAIGKTASNYADTHTRVTVPYSKLTGADSSHNLAAGLGSVGFRTGAFGKWHIAAEADLNAMGCEYSSTEYECDYAIAQQVVQQAGFDVAEAIFIANLNNCGTTCSDSFSHNMEWLTFEAITFMADALDASQPFFAYVNPTVPHGSDAANSLTTWNDGPYFCAATPAGTITDDWAQACDGSMTATADFSSLCSTCTMATRNTIWSSSSGSCSGTSDRSLCSGINWVDESLGAMYDFLDERAALDATMIMVFSDNGHAKATVYEWGVRTLLHVRYPDGGIAAGTTVNELVSTIDIVPTIFDFIGLSGTYDTNGVSWKAIADGSTTSLDRTEIIAEVAHDIAVIRHDIKLIFQDSTNANWIATSGIYSEYDHWHTEFQLYNLTVDEGETTNLADSDTDSLSTLQALLESHLVAVATNDGCCSVPMSLSATSGSSEITTFYDCGALSEYAPEYFGSKIDASDCTATVEGTECAVKCATGWDDDGDYGVQDTDAVECVGGVWTSASGWALTCLHFDHSHSYSVTAGATVSGSTIAVDFTAADGTEYTSQNKYLQTHCGDCDEADLLDVAGEMCWTQVSGCVGFVYFSGAATPFVMFKSDATTSETYTSIVWYQFDQSSLMYCDIFGDAVGGGVDTSACTGHLLRTECAVTCLSGYDQDGDYTTNGDTDAATCASDGSWVSASGWTLSSACSLIDYMASYTTHQSYKVNGNGLALYFTKSGASTSTYSNYYYQSYCGDDCPSESAFLNVAGELCSAEDDCAALTYYSAGDDPYVIFKKVATLTSASSEWAVIEKASTAR